MIHHEAILASAGSGKTFELAHRYIRLLALGTRPERIIALTFSRKAAGEIFDSIVKYLRQAAESPDRAKETAQRIGTLSLCQVDFLRLLRELLEALHRIHIGTLDSFTIGIIRAFPMELGISTAFEIMESDGAQAKSARQEVLRQIFNDRFVSRTAEREFLEAFKQATYGQEEKGLQRSLDTFIGTYREVFQTLPSLDAWGQPRIIWPEGSPWLEDIGDVAAIADDLKRVLGQGDLPEKVMTRWVAFLEAVRAFDSKSPWTREIEYLIEKLLEDVEGLRRGNGSLKIERTTCALSSEASRMALELLTHVVKIELTAAIEKTRGIYRVLDQYERFYNETVRERGKLTFADAQYLLTPANSMSGGMLLSRNPGSESRLYIDYRLDCKLDHWLLDEFQDTSDLQWEAIRNLADEVLQDTSGERSFFYVGDVKQAIYGWRGGNARLFGKILEQYEGQINTRPLHTSFRSCQPIIDTVNRAFGSLPEQLIPQATITEWRKAWQEHGCRKGIVPDHGYTAILEPSSQSGETKPTEEDRYRVAASLIKEIDPLKRGLSVAVLVRSNESGKRVVNLLRQECPGVTVVHEGRAAIKDNPVVSLFLSLAKFAAHPGDTLAWRHLQMSPLSEHFHAKGWDRSNLPLVLLGEIQNAGFGPFIRNWGRKLESVCPLDDFGRQRLRNLIDAAGEFDAAGSRDVNSFLHFIDNYMIHDLGTEDAVRVMTIHQSKGLGFDVVILPDLQGRSMTDPGNSNLFVARDPITNLPLWAMNLPRRLVAGADPTLASHLRTSEAEACFDALSLLYVALTRAKQGLYVITSFAGKNSKMVDAAAVLKSQIAHEGVAVTIAGEEFSCLYEAGERDWFKQSRPEERPSAAETKRLSKAFAQQPSLRTRLVRVVPSEQEEFERHADELFSEDFHRSLEFGKALHELFEQVEWIAQTDIEALIREWEKATLTDEELKPKVIERFHKSLEHEEIKAILSRPTGDAKLWREKRFEIILENKWVTGSFDRVVIERDANGGATHATIIDFKTDEVGGEDDLARLAERYRPQLFLYRKALSRMIGLDPSQISPKLVFTQPGKVIGLS